MAYHVTLTKQQIAMVKELEADYARSAMNGDVIGFSPLCTGIQDWLHTSFCLEDSHITEMALMGRGIFMLKLSTVEYASNLVAHSPIVNNGKIRSFVSWYREFKALDLDTQFHTPLLANSPKGEGCGP